MEAALRAMKACDQYFGQALKWFLAANILQGLCGLEQGRCWAMDFESVIWAKFGGYRAT